MMRPQDAEYIANRLRDDQIPAPDSALVQIADALHDFQTHDHSGQREDWHCLNLQAWCGERMGFVLKRLLDESAEARSSAQKLGRVRELLAYLRTAPQPQDGHDFMDGWVEAHHLIADRLEAALSAPEEKESSTPTADTDAEGQDR